MYETLLFYLRLELRFFFYKHTEQISTDTRNDETYEHGESIYSFIFVSFSFKNSDYCPTRMTLALDNSRKLIYH